MWMSAKIYVAGAMLLTSTFESGAESLLERAPQVVPPEAREWGKLEGDEEAQLPGMNFGPALAIKKHAVALRVHAALVACGHKGLANAVGPSSSDLVDYALEQVGEMDPEVPVSMRTAMSIAASLSYYKAGLIDSAIIAHELTPEDQRGARCKDWEHTAHQILNDRTEELGE